MQTFNGENDKNVRSYEDFFNTWGHFVVVSAYGGGSVEVQTNVASQRRNRWKKFKCLVTANFCTFTVS